jgi:hypothetical protein
VHNEKLRALKASEGIDVEMAYDGLTIDRVALGDQRPTANKL